MFQGEFEDNLSAIADATSDGFTFLMDPLGSKFEIQRCSISSANEMGTFLFNFMSDHINRHAEYSEVTKSIGLLLANPDWEQDFKKLNSALTNEQKILELLKAKIKQLGVARYAPDFSILVPTKNRIKMRLVLGTNSAKGVEVFRDVQAKVEISQSVIRDQVKEDARGERSLFGLPELAHHKANLDGVGGKVACQAVETYVLTKLLKDGPIPFGQLATTAMEDPAIRHTPVKDLFLRMRRNGRVNFDLPTRKIKPQETTIISIAKFTA